MILSIKRTSANKVSAFLKQGLGAADIRHRLKESRSWGQAGEMGIPNNCNRVRKVAPKNNRGRMYRIDF